MTSTILTEVIIPSAKLLVTTDALSYDVFAKYVPNTGPSHNLSISPSRLSCTCSRYVENGYCKHLNVAVQYDVDAPMIALMVKHDPSEPHTYAAATEGMFEVTVPLITIFSEAEPRTPVDILSADIFLKPHVTAGGIHYATIELLVDTVSPAVSVAGAYGYFSSMRVPVGSILEENASFNTIRAMVAAWVATQMAVLDDGKYECLAYDHDSKVPYELDMVNKTCILLNGECWSCHNKLTNPFDPSSDVPDF